MRKIGNYKFENFEIIPLFDVYIEVVVNPKIIQDWPFSGWDGGDISHTYLSMRVSRRSHVSSVFKPVTQTLPPRAGSAWPITACAECQHRQRPATRATVPALLSDAHAQEAPQEVVYAEGLCGEGLWSGCCSSWDWW